MSLTFDQRAQAAACLRQAQQRRQPIEPLSDQFPGLDIVDAYAIQALNIGTRLDAGALIRGHKVGVTSKALQQLLGVEVPNHGCLLDDMVHGSGAQIDAERYLQPRIEPEIGFVLGRPLRGPGITPADVLAASDAVVPCLELVDSRITDWKITFADVVADNASAAGVITGPSVPLGDAPLLCGIDVDLVINDRVVAHGTSALPLGDPSRAVAWLANTLAGADAGLDAGHLVLTGRCTCSPYVHAGDRVEAHFTGLGTVTAELV